MKKFDLNTFKGIQEFCIYVQSEANELSLNELKDLLKLSRSSQCLPKYDKSRQLLMQSQAALVNLIKEKTPWYKDKTFYIAVCCVVLTSFSALLLSLFSE